jgi:hypothetical protein
MFFIFSHFFLNFYTNKAVTHGMGMGLQVERMGRVCAFHIIYLVVIQTSKETGLESKRVCSKVISGYGRIE